ncbi:unnamed protein product [Cylindrotheca closterium]|uniref:Uncharacterized protein n=1 Tax=Cylindrotheca closterium TaxID=2856 RepID=A0AAD2FIV5_9STRA|nr:unnamed protein product [Cylindrotheca closterium]
MTAISFPTCIVLACILSFMMEDTSGFLLSEMIFGVIVFLTYFGLVESKNHRGEDANTLSDITKSEAKSTTKDVLQIYSRTREEEQRKKMMAQAEAELALKQSEMQTQEKERIRRETEAEAKTRAEHEAQEARRLKQIEDARLQAEMEQAERLKEAEEAKRRALEEERIQNELEEAARLQAEAKEAARLQAEWEEESRKQAEAEAKRKAEEAASRIQALEEETRKLEQIEAARARAEADQAARLQAEAESKVRAQEEESVRLKAEEKERLLAEQKLKDETDDEMDLEDIKIKTNKSTLDSTFHGSMGYLADTDAGVNAALSMRVRVLNETTGRAKDVVVPVTSDLTIEEAIYNNLKVREAGVRKWSKDIVQEVKQKRSEVVCLLLDPKTVNVIHTYSIADMKETSTEAMHMLASPEVDQSVRMILTCRKINEAQPLDSEPLVVSDHEQDVEDVDKSGFLSISDDDMSFANNELDSKDEVDPKVSSRGVDVRLSEEAENDTTDDGPAKERKKQQNERASSPKGNESVEDDGGHSVSDGSTFSSRSLEEKRRRKRELEARRLSISPSVGTAPQAAGGFSLGRFFSRQENREKSPE